MRRLVAAVTVALVAALTLGCVRELLQLDGQPAATSRPKVIDITFKGSDVTPNGDRHRRQGRDSRSSSTSTADKPGEIHVHSSPTSRSSSTRPARAPSRSSRSRRRARVTVESHTLDKVLVHPRRTVTPLLIGGLLPQHGLGGAQDLPISRELAIPAPRSRSRSRSSSSRWPGAPPGTTQPPAAGRLPPGCRRSSTRSGGAALLRLVGLLALAYLVVVAVLGKDLLINPIFGIFYVWIWVGMCRSPRCSSAGSGGRSARSALINAGIARRLGRRPGRGRCSPTPSGSACGRPRSVCTRSSGWSWSTPTTSTSSPVRLWLRRLPRA